MFRTEKLYYQDAYQSEFSAVVLACEEVGEHHHVVLDRTCFYPEGGGQPGDTGLINNVRVLDCRTTPRGIVHIAEEPIAAGTAIDGKIDFARRYSFMQNHTGEHILSGIVRKLHGYDNVGFHLGEHNMTMDFSGELSREELLHIEELANTSVYANISLSTKFYDSAEPTLLEMDYRSKKALTGSVRIVSVPEYDACACAGLHVRQSGEVGVVKVLSFERYKGGVRVYALCGREALEDYRRKNDITHKISALLSVKPLEAGAAVEKLAASLGEARKQLHTLRGEMFALKALGFEQGTAVAHIFENGLEADDMRSFACQIAGRAKVAFVFSGSDDTPDTFRYAICAGSADTNIAAVSKEFNAALNGRGGAKNNVAQGIVNASKADIESYLRSLRVSH
ncbi:MAG: alanyl-tRNA editing protein [Defluviitaleaceae bacterium]|nr:alanyl-tRNA editing protein [Defluviitaleaceae bacterium]